MPRLRLSICLPAIFVLVLAAAPLQGQEPQQIDVRTITLSYHAFNTDSITRVEGVNEANQPIIYGGRSNYQLLMLFSCNPCRIPNTFNTNGFGGTSNVTFGFSWAFDREAYLYLSEIEIEPLVLPATILRKPRLFSRSGAVRLKGKLEVIGINNTLVAVDHEIALEGRYKVDFSNDYVTDQRSVNFNNFAITLDRPYGGDLANTSAKPTQRGLIERNVFEGPSLADVLRNRASEGTR